MKHVYNSECPCARCVREKQRRFEQSVFGIGGTPRPLPKAKRARKRVASREEQHARYIDCGPGAWDDRGEP